jgi:glycosyltransferase
MIIITFTKNSSSTIKDTIKSLKIQKFKNFQWIIFDEKSKDSTVKIIKKSNLPSKIFYTNSGSIYGAYNTAIKLIKKKNINSIIFFLNSDDILSDKYVLSNVNNIFIKHKPDILYGNIKYFKKNQKRHFRKWNAIFEEKQIKINSFLFLLKKFYKKDFIKGWMFPHTSLFFHTKILNNLPLYDTRYKISADYLWSLKLLLKKNLKIFFWNRNIINMRYGGVSTNFFNMLNIFIEDWSILYKFYNGNLIKTTLSIFFKKLNKVRQFL